LKHADVIGEPICIGYLPLAKPKPVSKQENGWTVVILRICLPAIRRI
jgi:hypothetical protein